MTLDELRVLLRDVRAALGMRQVEMVLLAVRVARLRAAFAKYSRHLPTCLSLEFAPGACDCGLDAARAALLPPPAPAVTLGS